MSTTFGIKIPQEYIEKYGSYGSADITIILTGENFVEVAFRSSSIIYFRNSLALILPDNTPIYPIDNSHQGIYTIGDIKKAIEDQQK